MNKLYFRKLFIFSLIIILLISALIGFILLVNKSFEESSDITVEVQNKIHNAHLFATVTDKMIIAKRSYLLTGDDISLRDYNLSKAKANKILLYFNNGTASIDSDFAEDISEKYASLVDNIETKITNGDINAKRRLQIDKTDLINENIQKQTNTYILDNYGVLKREIKWLDLERTRYLRALVVGVLASVFLIIGLNAFLLRARSKTEIARESLKDSDKRFSLALEGTQDGIYDWDIRSDKVFYSKRYFEMLGYDREVEIGTLDIFKELAHPDDIEKVFSSVDKYFSHKTDEFNEEIRLKHKDGHYIWVQSRAKALFDDEGKPYRMVGAHTDITYLMEQQKILEKEKEKAVEQNQAKRVFLAQMSHEIRSPLTAISGIADILINNKESFSDKHVKLIETLKNSAASLRDLIEDILDFSKIEQGKIILENDNFVLSDLLTQINNMMEIKAKQKNIKLSFSNSLENKTIFYGDQGRIQQILVNLIDNAIKFTPENGSVDVTIQNQEQGTIQNLLIYVKDTGIGIKEENHSLIFERFQQVDQSDSRKFGGTGLGLPISCQLARLMSGEIDIDSVEGDGATFCVRLPYIKDKELFLADEKEHTIDEIKKLIEEKITPDFKALIVDDIDSNYLILSHLLNDIGIECDHINNGFDAIDNRKEQSYDLILMDIQMPEIDGFETTEKIREWEGANKKAAIPIIGVTAHALVINKNDCLKSGMNDYLEKPIDIKKLFYKIFKQL